MPFLSFNFFGQPVRRLCSGALCAVLLPAYSQLARKPSYYDAQRDSAMTAALAAPPVAVSGPLQEKLRAGKGALAALPDQASFDRLARVYNPGTPLVLPHVLFVIDLKAKPARIYYLDTPRYQLHVRFLQASGLARHAGKRAIDSNYLLPNRRFLLGTLSWQSSLSGFTYEFWEGDQLTALLLRQTEQSVTASIFAPVQFKANSTLHARRAQEAGIGFVTQEALLREQPYLALNTGTAVGRVRLVAQASGVNALLPDDIAVLRQVPLSLPPVAGVLTERPSTALSHVNLLAKGWGIPNAYVRDAAAALRPYAGQWVELKVSASDYALRRLSAQEVAALPARAPPARMGTVKTPRPDLREQRLLPLSSLRGPQRAQCGAKAANLGVLQAARIAQTFVPDGFCIPFSHYQRFAEANGLAQRLAHMQEMPGFQNDPEIRLNALAQLRADILQWPVDSADAAAWQARWQSQLHGAGVFVRSSSNSEDLPGFSGAGLYTTVPNVKTEAALTQAVKAVWASVFNPEAWEARRAVGFDAQAVSMAVLVQAAIDADSAGVMITRDPFDAGHPFVTYISAKRGLGTRVVEGRRIAEEVMYSSWSKAIQVLSRSGEDTALQLDAQGGVKEVPIEAGRAVLNDALVLRLAGVAAAVKRLFRGMDQDIEWAIMGERIVLLQARPYVATTQPR